MSCWFFASFVKQDLVADGVSSARSRAVEDVCFSFVLLFPFPEQLVQTWVVN